MYSALHFNVFAWIMKSARKLIEEFVSLPKNREVVMLFCSSSKLKDKLQITLQQFAKYLLLWKQQCQMMNP